jgi:hypothetical protein
MFSAMKNQKGTALIAVLLVAVVVAGLSATFVMRSVGTSRATRCNLDGERALSIAEGALDLSIQQVVAGGDGNISGQLGGGTYTVAAASPYPGIYTLTSTATYDGITREVEATIQLIDLDPLSPPAAITIIDDGSRSIFSARLCGNAFIITGHDQNINGTPGTQPIVAGIGVFNQGSLDAIVAALHHNGVQDDNIQGTGPNPSVVNVSAFNILTFNGVQDFSDQMLLTADTVLASFDSTGVSWGTDAQPKITYVQGNCSIGGNSTGAGILVVDGTLSIKGNFTFNGLVVLTGNTGSPFDFSSRGNTNVHGAMIILNPAGSLVTVQTFSTFDLRGNINVYYSSEGMNIAKMATNGAGTPLVISWRRVR